MNVICSGDKFNAITEALGAILNFIRIRDNSVIHLVYAENGYSTDFSFHNFKLPAKAENNRLSLTLGSDNFNTSLEELKDYLNFNLDLKNHKNHNFNDYDIILIHEDYLDYQHMLTYLHLRQDNLDNFEPTSLPHVSR